MVCEAINIKRRGSDIWLKQFFRQFLRNGFSRGEKKTGFSHFFKPDNLKVSYVGLTGGFTTK